MHGSRSKISSKKSRPKIHISRLKVNFHNALFLFLANKTYLSTSFFSASFTTFLKIIWHFLIYLNDSTCRFVVLFMLHNSRSLFLEVINPSVIHILVLVLPTQTTFSGNVILK